MKNKNAKWFLLSVLVLVLMSVTACGGSGGIPNGTFVLAEGEWGVYSPIVFNGNRVTMRLDPMPGFMPAQSFTSSYRFSNNELTITVEGMTMHHYLEVVDNNTLIFDGFKYIRR